jgi:hypothetical protein
LIDAVDLAEHFKADPVAAGQRYGKRTLKVQGEVVGFGKTLFLRSFAIHLKTNERFYRVICSFSTPEQFKSVFSINNGTELVGEMANGKRSTIARLGDTIQVSGTCKGLNDSAVNLSGCALKSVH